MELFLFPITDSTHVILHLAFEEKSEKMNGISLPSF